ncbi:hypothetical protein RISW2_02940 [Roseivivax isoporae LMG 25204]|uniref:Uncharacterized protein n=1 Tax=Roseivivax isoporae LMG 25204 TaxID=1449351 RepID=X7FAS3_9RHOB|nr:hypothetical protein RISW2_02940 [Roseivivax isoporae LMG 25204]
MAISPDIMERLSQCFATTPILHHGPLHEQAMAGILPALTGMSAAVFKV